MRLGPSVQSGGPTSRSMSEEFGDVRRNSFLIAQKEPLMGYVLRGHEVIDGLVAGYGLKSEDGLAVSGIYVSWRKRALVHLCVFKPSVAAITMSFHQL